MTETVCDHCGYGWEYSGDLERATCPNCGKKTTVDDTHGGGA